MTTVQDIDGPETSLPDYFLLLRRKDDGKSIWVNRTAIACVAVADLEDGGTSLFIGALTDDNSTTGYRVDVMESYTEVIELLDERLPHQSGHMVTPYPSFVVTARFGDSITDETNAMRVNPLAVAAVFDARDNDAIFGIRAMVRFIHAVAPVEVQETPAVVAGKLNAALRERFPGEHQQEQGAK